MHYSVNYCFTNFKNFTDVRIERYKPLTILIGKNGSGKTNLIEGIEVLAHLAQGTPLHKFSDVGEGGECEVRGGLGNCIGFGTADFELSFKLEAKNIEGTSRKITTNYKIKIGRVAQHEPILSEERLFVTDYSEHLPSDLTIFDARRNGDMLKVEYNSFTAGNLSTSIHGGSSVISRYVDEIIAASVVVNPQGLFAALAVKEVSDYLRTAYIFDTNPKAMRGYEQIDMQAKLSRDGGNLSAVLYALKKNGKLRELESITEIARHLPEEPFVEIGFDIKEDKVMLGFYVGSDNASERLLDARVLSDGTLRMLAVLTALETVPIHSRIVVEEFDNGLHPSRARLLVEHLHKTAEQRGLKILITTHNPAVMNALSEEQMENVLLCHRDPKTRCSKLTPLMSVQDVDLMMLRGSLGDLVTDEIVEKYLSPEYRKKRAEIAQKWKERYFP